MSNQQTIVIPWDFSERAKASLRYALRRFSENDIRVFCVLERPNPYGPGMNWGPDVESTSIQHCTKEFYKSIGQSNDPNLSFTAEFGEPADEIVRFAHDQRATFIVMSTHGRTGLQKIFIGSTAQKVLAQSRVPVILLPPRWYESQIELESESGTNRIGGGLAKS